MCLLLTSLVPRPSGVEGLGTRLPFHIHTKDGWWKGVEQRLLGVMTLAQDELHSCSEVATQPPHLLHHLRLDRAWEHRGREYCRADPITRTQYIK